MSKESRESVNVTHSNVLGSDGAPTTTLYSAEAKLAEGKLNINYLNNRGAEEVQVALEKNGDKSPEFLLQGDRNGMILNAGGEGTMRFLAADAQHVIEDIRNIMASKTANVQNYKAIAAFLENPMQHLPHVPASPASSIKR